ncbi:MAG TPA: CAP domain-containing protein [Kofleriaceae bacterium]|nr:CAP domain-containing protein [Kofleriaceae bacterium]
MKNFCGTGISKAPCHARRMRWLLMLLASCGQMYSKPASQESTAAPDDVEAPAPAKPLPTSKPVEKAAEKPATKAEAAKGPSDPAAKAFVDAHNAARAKNCAPPLTWSPQIAKVAQAWADQLKAKGCVFGHSGNMKYGENLAAGTIGALDPESTVAMWYDEIKLYKFPDGGFSMQTGHFTQLVWTTTKQVGCGHVQCKGNDIYVCNYDPPGNYEGEYKTHVLPTSCKK